MEELWRILLWSLHWLYVGQWPDEDHNGRKYTPAEPEYAYRNTWLANGFYGFVYILKADLDHFGKAYGLPKISELHPCFLCKCDRSATKQAWTYFKDDATWLASVWDKATWTTAYPNRHYLFRMLGVSIMSVIPDLMHVKHLGTDQYFYGSVLKFIVAHVLASEGSSYPLT
eukprot:8375175-Karenia_brevis.AAC.1